MTLRNLFYVLPRLRLRYTPATQYAVFVKNNYSAEN